MLDRLQRQSHARFFRQLPGPCPGAQNHPVGGDLAAVDKGDTHDMASFRDDAPDLHAFEESGAMVFRRPRIGHAQVDGIDTSIFGNHQGAGMRRHIELRHPHLLRPDDLRCEAHMPPNRANAAQFIHAFGSSRQPVATSAAIAGAHAGFSLELWKKLQPMGSDPGHAGGGPQWPHNPRRMPAGTGRELVALHKRHTSFATFCQMIGNAQADGAAADDHNLLH